MTKDLYGTCVRHVFIIPSQKDGYSGRQDMLEIQFIIGACKVQANVHDVLDGMDMMRMFADGNVALPASAAALYILGLAYEKLRL